jgi:aspartyl protease family protein
MLRLALGYLAMAVVVAIGFASLQGYERPERRAAAPASERAAASEDDGLSEDESFASEDEDYASEEDENYQSEDESYAPEDESYSEEDEGSSSEDQDYSEEEADQDDGGLEYVVEADSSGHYLIEATVNGAPVTFLVDTGASDIVLTLDDARRVGLRPRSLEYTQRFATANGEVRGAPVVLREVRIGQARLFDVSASVNEAALDVSLLGMSFLEQLSGYEVERGRLILRW